MPRHTSIFAHDFSAKLQCYNRKIKSEKPRARLYSVACIPLDRPCVGSSKKKKKKRVKKDIKMTDGNGK